VHIPTAEGEPDDAVVPLKITDLTFASAPDGGVSVRGEVTNPSDRALSVATLAIVLRDGSGSLLGGVYDVAIGPLRPGATRSFETAYPATQPVDASEVATVEGAASGSP
jgi:hypothetical protein